MDILDHPDAQALLADAQLGPDAVQACADRLSAFAQRYLPRFHRDEQRAHALTILRGKLTGLQRKTTEPIATEAGPKRRPLQLFVGAGGWDDAAVLAELRRHVAEELGHRDAVFVRDSSGFPKKGPESCGVARPGCGRLGKVDNCQVGVFLAYAAPRGQARRDARLYLPEDWAQDRRRRAPTYVPEGVAFPEKWRIGRDLLDGARGDLAGGWVVADDEFGRVSDLRVQRRLGQSRSVVDVPCSTWVRDPPERRPPVRPGGKPRWPAFERVDQWVARQPQGRWRKVRGRDGAKGPREVKVLLARVQTKEADGGVGPRERWVVLRGVAKQPKTCYAFSNARQAKRAQLAQVHGARHRVEELLQAGNGEVGLDHYEVRSWVGWHHHLTRSRLALWFLELERLRLGKKTPAVTVAQVRAVFTELLREPRPSAGRIAEVVSHVLRRNEASRIDHWYEATGRLPPRRRRPGPRPRGQPRNNKVTQ